MGDSFIVVEGYRSTPADRTNLRDDAWSFALDQRAFGPRRLVVAFADPSGRLRTIAHAPRSDPPENALEACIRHLGWAGAAAVAYCDEEVEEGPPSPRLAIDFALRRSVAAGYGVHLVDWIACDDQLFRSSRLATAPAAEWWDVPSPPPARPAGRGPGTPHRRVRRRR